MKLKKIKFNDFRGYSSVEVDLDRDINVIIGRNDVGKSTIIDAMNIFFNDNIKPEILDCNMKSSKKQFDIICFFEIDEDEIIILDSTNPTTLKEEYLLNKDGLLEIKKSYNASGISITASNLSVSINAYYPVIHENILITLKAAALKSLLKNYEDDIKGYDSINKSKKADMRYAILNHLICEETLFKEMNINIKDIQDDSLKTWDKIKSSLPLFTLFQSDRTNTDNDKEVQDPMKAITKLVLSEMEEELNQIKDKVVKRVEDIGFETIEKLRDFDVGIANTLKTIPELKSWDSIFKFSLDTDDDIPLNKRGSGIRRLILLSYFRAQAEKDASELGKNDIIYAIEEPETSQHPDYQKMVIESLFEISQKENHQIFITTHTPEIVKMVPKESLILVMKDESGNPTVVTDESIKISEIINTLGILPTINSKVVVCVEGKHDCNFIRIINDTVPEFKEIIDLNTDDVRIFDIGGSKLINWINDNHFKDSGIKEFHIYDSDIPKYVKKVDELNDLNDGRRIGRVTSMLEMENYIPVKLIEEEFDCDLEKYKDNWSQFDIPEYLKNCTMMHIRDVNQRENAIKGVINSTLVKKVTAENLKEHGVFDEISGWFELIKGCLD